MKDTKSEGSERGRTASAAPEATHASRSPSVGAIKTGAMQHKCVLIVDRDADALAGLAHLIESMGYAVVATRENQEAFEIARRRLPDAALVDLGVPTFEGLDVARGLREIAGKRPLLLIALGGWGQPQYRDMALAAGCDVHWVKPISPDQLSFLLSMSFV
jgi:CheY-like chemotaxis protein